MVQIGIKIVDSDSIDTQPLHENSISETDIGITQRVNARARIEARRTARLIAMSRPVSVLVCFEVRIISLTLHQ